MLSKKYIYVLLVFALILSGIHSSAKQTNLDSLFTVLANEENDTTKIEILLELTWNNRRQHPEISHLLLDTTEYLLNTQIAYEFMRGKIYSLRGDLARYKGKEGIMLDEYQKSISFFTKYLDNDDKNTRSLAIRNISICYNNMADSYAQKGDYGQALSLYQKSLRAIQGIGTKTGFSTRYFNIGLSYLDLNQIDSAEHYITLSHLIETELNDPIGLYWSNYGLGRIALKKDNLSTSRKYFEKALDYAKQSGDRASEMECLQFIADVYARQENFQEATNNYIRSLNIAQEIGYTNAIPSIYNTLGEIFKRRGRLQQSIDYYEKYIALKDSLNKEESNEKLLEFQAKFEDEKKQQRIALLEKDQKIQEDQEKLLWGGIGATLIVLLLALNLFRITKKNNKDLNKKNQTIEAINAEVSSKNLEITDSINYAKKIQKAMLPSIEKFKELFEDAFVYFNPKDIVSGDFYWGTKIGNTVLFCAADCTGHGVPGAFMSLIGSNILDKIVGEYGIISPELILHKLSEEIYNRLRADKSMNVKDGMDLSLCAIDLKTLKIKIAGAYNPTYLIRNNKLTQFKGDKLQLGNPNQIAGRKFKLNEVQLQKGDLLYLFSDGFPDQKGGKLGKKFFYPPFRDLLVEISKLSMEDQQGAVEATMMNWMKDKEQQDDMLILGIKI